LRALLAALVLGLVAAPTAAAVRVGPPTDPEAWTSYGYDNELSNAIATKALTLRTVPNLNLVWSLQLDGAVYASPLAAKVDGERLVFAATEAGSVYAVDAGNGRIVWQKTLGVVQTLQCGNWGITSTGAIDLERGILFEISADGLLHGLDLASGEEVPGYPIALVTNNLYEYVWGGLRIADGRLYVVVASYCDVGPPGGPMPEGRLLAVSLDRPAEPASWDPVPGAGNLGGMWGWGGVSIDPADGRVFTGVGNSWVWSEKCHCYVDNAGYGDSIVALTPDLSSVLDSDNPAVIPATTDSDFGAAPLLFQPDACPPLAAMNNKDGALYVWDRTRLSTGPLVRIPLGDGVAAFVGSPAWSAVKQMVYVGQSVIREEGRTLGNGVTAWHVDPGCGFRPIWSALVGQGNQSTPLVVGNVVFATGGKTGGFFALNAAKGSLLWSSPTEGGTVAAMISVAGTVYGADTSGVLYAFEPFAEPKRLPSAVFARVPVGSVNSPP
jgi:outer membrane protein assembly factor BamB